MADGYEDWISPSLTNFMEVVLDIPMKKSSLEESVRGVVLQPNGEPAVGAQVALLTFEHNVRLRKRAFEGDKRWMLQTDSHGAFQFPVNREAHSVAAVNANGYLLLRLPPEREPVTLQMQSWGRVEVTVDESARAQPVETIKLYDPAADNYQGRVSTLSSYAVKPDVSRRFVFESVPPGEFSVFINSKNGIPFHHQTSLVVKPGETTSVVIAEWPGTRVIGRFVAPLDRTISWKKDFVLAHLYADVPPPPLNEGPPEERKRRELDFWTSPAGRERVNTPLVYSAVVRDDGSFVSLERLRPGKYRFTTVFKDASVTRHITISEEQPPEMDLGEIPLR
jgi:hypothetical protein